MLSITTSAQTVINFDTERIIDAPQGETTNDAIKRLIIANKGAIIEFNSSEYDLGGKVLNIPRNITLKGTINNNTIDLTKHGADNSNIVTKFINCGVINFASNDIKIENLALIRTPGAKYSVFLNMIHGSYHNVNKIDKTIYSGIEFNNVIVSGGGYQVRTGNGIGGKFTNVSFIEFNTIGFWFDRKGNVTSHPKVEWKNCTFSVKNTPGGTSASGTNIEFNDRAVSFDGGNTSNPIVWDHSGSTIEKCHFINTGLGASSRGTNVIINDNIFDDNAGIVDFIHIEEFSSNFTLTNNTFNSIGDAQSKVLVFDRELQIVNNITIANNTVNGEIHFFISAYAPNGLTIENNDFSNASTQLGSPFINLTYNENAIDEPITPRDHPDRSGEFFSENIIVRNNIGLERPETGTFEVNLKEGSTNSSIDFPAARTTINYIEAPEQLIANGTYEIVHLETGNNIIPMGIEGQLITSSTITSSSNWLVDFVPPFSYNIQNTETSNYLELAVPFTESNIFGDPSRLPELFPFAKNNYNSLSLSEVNRLPFWSVRKTGDSYVIFPGGNEMQSAISVSDNNVVNMIPARQKETNTGRRIPVILDNNSKWKFRALDENFVSWNSNQKREFETSETTEQTISYGVRANNQVLINVQFGLAIKDINDGTITKTATQNIIATPVAPLTDSKTFRFTIPNDMAPSSQLPQGKTYVLLSKLTTRESGTETDLFSSIHSPITIFKAISESEITWDTNSNTNFVIGTTSEQTITHNVLNSETPEYTQFGLFIANTVDNSIVEVIKPQSFPSVAHNILQRETKTFNYTVPNDILPSNELPSGQRYLIRVIVASKNSDEVSKYAVVNTPVTVIEPNNIKWNNKINNQFEDGETTSQSITYKLQETDKVNFVQFGLLIVNATNNSYISAVPPQKEVTGNNLLTSDIRDFDFTIPGGITSSANLPVNQKYQIRARVSYKDSNNVDHFALDFTDVTIAAAGSNFIKWDTNYDTEFELNETSSQTISYRVQEDESIDLIQYGLILTTSSNGYISAIAPAPNVIGDNTIKEGTRTFNFSVPSEIAISEDLPNNQKYRIRTRVDAKDAANNPLTILQFTDVTIIKSSLSVDDPQKKQNSIIAYPNPVSTLLHLSKAEDYFIYNMQGSIVLESNQKDAIDVSQLKSGIYLLVDKNGNHLKFIKK